MSLYYGRRCRTRTAIQGPKPSVLPLHHILLVRKTGLEPVISKLSVWCLTNLATPAYTRHNYLQSGFEPEISP